MNNITVFILVVVLVTLLIIYLLIKAYRSSTKEKEDNKEAIEPELATSNTFEEEINKPQDEELIAVISAAVVASLGVSISEINIKEIRRVSQNTPAWAMMARSEQVTSRL